MFPHLSIKTPFPLSTSPDSRTTKIFLPLVKLHTIVERLVLQVNLTS